MSIVYNGNGLEWFGKLSGDAVLSRVGINYTIILGKMLTSDPKDDRYTFEKYYCAANVHFDGIISEDLKQMWFNQKEKEQYLVNPGDLLIVEGGAGAGGCAVVSRVDEPIYIQNSIMIVRGKNGNSTVFLKYLIEYLVKGGYVDVVCNKATIPHFTKDKLSMTPFPLFSIIKQQRIAEFLDRKCAEIDSIIAKTKATIEQYKALKQSVITQAVTKGIRPDRPMKDSGIEWIGEIPQEWNCNITKRFCTFKTGSTPSTANQEWFDGELNWFTPSDFNESYYLSKSSRALSVKAKQDNVATIIPNNTVMIIGIGGTAGKIGLTMCECSCNQQITALINSPRLLSKYLMYWMIANTKYLKETALFTTLPIINNQTIGSYPIIVPSDLSEQQEIADYLDSKCAEIDRLIAAKEQLLTELESYKKSVIYEYVTGKKEV